MLGEHLKGACRESKFLAVRESLIWLLGSSGGGGNCLFKDRKSTRLNSSHLVISYAVFCLKKKKIYCYAYSGLDRLRMQRTAVLVRLAHLSGARAGRNTLRIRLQRPEVTQQPTTSLWAAYR